MATLKYDRVFFDLDGTITDSAPGILASVRYALRKYDEQAAASGACAVREPSDGELNFFIVPPLVDSFRKLLGCGPEAANRCLMWYREFYTGGGMLMNRVYPGVPEMLAELRRDGARLVLATAKPEVYARRILEHFGLAESFDYIHGATLDEERNQKHQVIAWALENSGGPGRTVMVGDRENDITGAKVNGLPSIGVLWGYGSEAELREAGADIICGKAEELFSLLTL